MNKKEKAATIMELMFEFLENSSLQEFTNSLHSNLNGKIMLLYGNSEFNISEPATLLSVLAIHYDNIKDVKEKILYVLENGGDPNQYDNHDNTPIWYASSEDTSLLQLLIDYNGDINKEQAGNCLPVFKPLLHYQLHDNPKSFEIFRFLLEKGALLDIPEKNIFVADHIDTDTHSNFIETIHEYHHRLSPKTISKLKEIKLKRLFS